MFFKFLDAELLRLEFLHSDKVPEPESDEMHKGGSVTTPASYPDVSLSMKMSAQRKAGRRQRARRLADLAFKMAARVMADEYAIFKISSGPFILRI